MKKKFRLDSNNGLRYWSWFILLTIILLACDQPAKQVDVTESASIESKKESLLMCADKFNEKALIAIIKSDIFFY